MPVEGGTGDVERFGDFLDGMRAIVVHPLRLVELALGELWAPAADPTARAGGGQTIHGVGDDQLTLEFGQHAEHAERGAALHGGGVDALFDHVQADVVGPYVGAEVDQVLDRA